MQSREKLLAGMLGACVLLFLFIWALTWTINSYKEYRDTRRALESKAMDLKRLRAESETLHEHRGRLLQRSLPADVGKAQTQYAAWLSALVKRSEVNFRGHSVDPTGEYPAAGFRRLRFRVRGQASFEEVTRFLHEFYSADLLHKITLLQMTPQRDSSQVLDVLITIEALSLTDGVMPKVKEALAGALKVNENKVTPEATLAGDLGANSVAAVAAPLARMFGVDIAPGDLVADPKAKEFPETHTVQMLFDSLERKVFASKDSPRLELGGWEAYKKKLVKRDFFDFNRPPRVGNTRFTATVGRPFRGSVRATDPDNDALTIELMEDAVLPPGMTFDKGTLSWDPSEELQPRTYRFGVRISDDGDPPIHREETITVSLGRPTAPPVRKEFNHVRHAYLEAVNRLGRPQAWITVRTLGRELTLHEGDKEKIGDVEFTVLEINPTERTVVIEFADYKRTVRLGETLASGREGI